MSEESASTPLTKTDVPEIMKGPEKENQAPATRGSASRSLSYYMSGCVLWDAAVLEKMKKNEDCQYEAYTSQAISKMLSKSVISMNKELDWRKPHILLEVVGKKIIKKRDEFSIQVAEQTWFKNSDTPLKNRLWRLDLAEDVDMIEIAKEITRQPTVKTTVMLWDYVKCTFKEPKIYNNNTILGKIKLNRSSDVCPRILIFHRQEIHPQRRLHIQSQLRTSELKHFHKLGVFRYTTKSDLTNDGNVTKLAFNFISTVSCQDLVKNKSPVIVPSSNVIAIPKEGKTVGVNNAQVKNISIVPARSTGDGGPAEGNPKKRQKLNGMNNSQPPVVIAGPSSRLLPPTSFRKETSACKDIDDSQKAFLISQDMQHELEATQLGLPAPIETNEESSQAYRLTQFINELH